MTLLPAQPCVARYAQAYRNAYINLALPLFSLCEPIAPAKAKFKKWEWSIWDKIELEGQRSLFPSSACLGLD